MLSSDIAYGSDPLQRAAVRLPDAHDAPVLVYFHGGGLEGGSRDDHAMFARHLVEGGTGILSADYRLLPAVRAQDPVDDAASCVAWALERFEGRPVLVGGTSAGAYLAMMLRFDRTLLAGRGADVDAVRGWFFDAGQPTTHYNVLRERGIDTRRIVVDDAAPLFHVGTDSTAVPTLITLAEDDIPGRAEQTSLLLATMRAFGIDGPVRHEVLDGHTHSSYLSDEDGSRRLAASVLELVRDVTGPAR